jgi:hypothetical protein
MVAFLHSERLHDFIVSCSFVGFLMRFDWAVVARRLSCAQTEVRPVGPPRRQKCDQRVSPEHHQGLPPLRRRASFVGLSLSWKHDAAPLVPPGVSRALIPVAVLEPLQRSMNQSGGRIVFVRLQAQVTSQSTASQARAAGAAGATPRASPAAQPSRVWGGTPA